MGLGVTELILILVILLLVFGARRLPELGRGLGKAVRGAREAADRHAPAEEEHEDGKKVEGRR